MCPNTMLDPPPPGTLKDKVVFNAKPPPRDATIFEINNSFNMRRWTGHTWNERSIDNGQILFLPGCKQALRDTNPKSLMIEFEFPVTCSFH